MLAADPAAFVRVIFPVVAPAGTVAVTCVSEFTEKFGAAVPFNATAVAPVKPVPVRVTTVATGPLVGESDVIAGAVIIEKIAVLTAVPFAVVTLMVPFRAPVGTAAVIWESEMTVKVVAAIPLKATAVAPVNENPEMVTGVPTTPLAGAKDVIEGTIVTAKTVALLAIVVALVTVIFPVAAPAGTVAVICVSELIVKFAAAPLNATEVATLNPVPVNVTTLPTGPLAGVKEVNVSGCTCVQSVQPMFHPGTVGLTCGRLVP